VEQPGWRCCNDCNGLFYAGGGSLGACPVGAGHDDTGSGDYVLSTEGTGRYGWHWCSKCMGLFFAKDGLGHCPAGGSHDDTGSGDYVLSTDGTGQAGWSWCNKCMGFYYAYLGPGVCPAGEGHDDTDDDDYVVPGGAINVVWSHLSSQPPGSPHIEALSYSDDGALWAVDPTVPFEGNNPQNLYLFDGADWRLLDAYVTAVAEDRIGLAWGVNAAELSKVACNIYVFIRTPSSPQLAAGSVGLLTSIAVGADSDVWGINDTELGGDNVYRYIGGDTTWAIISSSAQKLTKIAAGGPTPGGAPGVESSVWAISTATTTDDNVYRYVGGDVVTWALVPGVNLTSISVAADGSVVGIDASESIWTYNFVGNRWVQVEGKASAVAAGSDGLIWAVSGGTVQYAVLTESRSFIEVNDETVHVAVYGLRDASARQIGRSLTRAPLQLLREHWVDDAYRAPPPGRRSGDARTLTDDVRTALGEIQASPEGIKTGAGDPASNVIEVTKWVWDIVKDGRPTYSGPSVVQSSVLHPSDTNWVDYQAAVPGGSSMITFRRENFFGVTRVEFKMKLGGTYRAAGAVPAITPGYYIPEMHFEFAKTYQGWGVNVNGSAIVTAASNIGGTTTDNPVNPLVTVVASLQASTIVNSVSETFTFRAVGKTGFTAGP